MTRHGTGAAYRWGCRCDECKRAHANRIKKQRNERKTRPTVQRGVAMTRPLFDVAPINNGACQLPRPAFDPRIDQKTRATYGAESDRIFFPPGEPGRHPSTWTDQAENQAKAVCNGCPALETCRSWVLAREASTGLLEKGIWGGLGEDERATILKRHNAQIAGAVNTREDVA